MAKTRTWVMFQVIVFFTMLRRIEFSQKGDSLNLQLQSMLNLLHDFINCLPPDLRLILIEPKVLWSLIPANDRQFLEHEVAIERLQGIDNVLSLAIFQENLHLLEEENVRSMLESSGYSFSKCSAVAKSGMKLEVGSATTSHLFYFKRNTIFHIIVFYEIYHYLWHWKVARLPNFLKIPRHQRPIFCETDSAFERFRIHERRLSGFSIHFPLDIPEFLVQVRTSRFVPCLGAYGPLNATYDTDRPEEMAAMAVKHTRFVADTHFVAFCLFGHSLLSWYRHCRVTPKNRLIEFVAKSDVMTNDLLRWVEWSQNLELFSWIGKDEEFFQLSFYYSWLMVNVVFAREDVDVPMLLAVEGRRPREQSNFEFSIPNFSVCSGDLYGKIVHVPCSPVDIIEAQFGMNWKNISLDNWDPLSPRIVNGRRKNWDRRTR